MAIQAVLGDYLAVDDSGGSARDISDNVNSVEITNNQNLIDATTLSKSAIERIIGLGDFGLTINGTFDSASNKSHDVFKVKSGTRTVSYAIGGNTQGNPIIEVECLVSEYNISRGADGTLTFTAALQGQSGSVATWSVVP